MAELKGTVVASSLVPTDSRDTYSTHDAKYGKGGHRSVNTIDDRNTISPDRREIGMTVFVQYVEEADGESITYELIGGLTNEHWRAIEKASGINIAVDTALKTKVDKEAGKGLSEQNYTTAEKNKLANLTDNFKGGFADSIDRDDALTSPEENWYILQHDTDTIWYYKNGVWINTGNKSTGDMLKAIYDPTGINADAFSMGNMVETLDKKVFTSLERQKLDGIEAGAEVNTVKSVNNKTGIIMLTKSDFGLDKVDNTPDNEKIVLESGRVSKKLIINNIEYDGSKEVVIDINSEDILPEYTDADKGKSLQIDQITGEPTWKTPTGGSGGTFTGSASIDVGGVKSGDSWVDAPLADVVNAIINPELFPTLNNPSFSITSPSSGLKEVGTVLDVVLNVSFNRGSITPQYTSADGYRSGTPTTYTYTGPSLNESKESTALTDTKTITGYTIPLGNSTFSCVVAYSEGTQPKSSKGNDFNTPLPAGSLPAKSITINGVYALYSGIDTVSKQPLQVHGGSITVDAPIDMNVSGNRFVIQYPAVWSANTPVVQQENELSKAWDNQNMSDYEITDIIKSSIGYKQVKYIGSGIGARKLRLVF